MKSSRKLKSMVPNYCNNSTPRTTSTPPIDVAIIGLFNTYSEENMIELNLKFINNFTKK